VPAIAQQLGTTPEALGRYLDGYPELREAVRYGKPTPTTINVARWRNQGERPTAGSSPTRKPRTATMGDATKPRKRLTLLPQKPRPRVDRHTSPYPLMRSPRYSVSDEDVAEAIMKHHGFLKYVAAEFGLSYGAILARVKQSETLTRMMFLAREDMKDVAEMGLYRALEGEKPWAIQLALKTLAKNRGYSERVEHTGKDGEALIPPNSGMAGLLLACDVTGAGDADDGDE
jgi:hypothetical protein